MVHAQRHSLMMSKSNELIIVRLFIALSLACIDTIWSLYMNSFGLSESTIGYISASFIALTIAFALVSTPILERFKQTRLLAISLGFTIVAYFVIGLSQSFIVFIFMAILLSLSDILRRSCFNIIFRDNISTKNLNKEEGLLYTIINVGWLLGPLIAGFFLVAYGIESVFLISGSFLALSLLIFLFMHLKNLEKKHVKPNFDFLTHLRSFFANKKVHLPYIMVVGIEIWWALVYIYIPLFIINQGINVGIVGIFLTAVVVPLILFEGKAAALSEKLGFRFFFVTGFSGLTILTFILFFINNIYFQLGLIVLGSLFVAMIEPIQDTFFFKRVAKRDEEKFFPLFGTSVAVGGVVGRVIIATVLLFFSTQYTYLVLTLFLGIITICALKIPPNAR